MQQRLSKIHPSTASTPSTAATSIKANDALVSATPPSSASASGAWDEAHQTRQVNALYSLLENRYSNQSPMPQNLRRPSGDPEYYDLLVRELEEAPNRSWFAAVLKRIRGSLRFS